jgi:hypothetical protein
LNNPDHIPVLAEEATLAAEAAADGTWRARPELTPSIAFLWCVCLLGAMSDLEINGPREGVPDYIGGFVAAVVDLSSESTAEAALGVLQRMAEARSGVHAWGHELVFFEMARAVLFVHLARMKLNDVLSYANKCPPAVPPCMSRGWLLDLNPFTLVDCQDQWKSAVQTVWGGPSGARELVERVLNAWNLPR